MYLDKSIIVEMESYSVHMKNIIVVILYTEVSLYYYHELAHSFIAHIFLLAKAHI